MKNNFLAVLCTAILMAGCEKSDSGKAAAPSTGKGGSLARFTIVGNYLYAISDWVLYTVNISNPAAPIRVNESKLRNDMETIYAHKNRLYVGARTGMYIYSIDTLSSPRLIGEARHARSCDPVVANDTVSYATLKGGTPCGPATSGLYVYDVKNLQQPVLKKLIEIPEPLGLGIADSALYVCSANQGLQVFSVGGVHAFNPVSRETVSGNFVDVIPYDNVLICWIRDGISLYDITNRLKPVFMQKVAN